METILFWIVCILYTIIGIANIAKKNYFNVSTFILFGVTLPLILYFFKWSDFIFEEPSNTFYTIFIYFYAIAIIFSFINNKTKYKPKEFEIKHEKAIDYLTLGYCILYVVESYLGSGTFFPAFNKIDIHTYAFPIISFITRSIYPFLLLNFVIFIKNNRKRCLFNMLILLLLPVVTRSARINVTITLVQVGSFIIFYLIYYKDSIKASIVKKIKIIGVVGTILVVFGMVLLTNYRMNDYGEYDLDYAEEIKYTGPKLFGNIISVYYGYFPMSFNNLNYNINHLNIKHNYIGLYTFSDLFFGIFQLDNIFGISTDYPSTVAHIITTAATVRTAFYEYYYDFGLLSFIPILVMFIYYAVIKKMMKNTTKMVWDFLYFFYVPLFFFLSFQNLFFAATNLWTVAITCIFYKIFIKDTTSKQQEEMKYE